MLKQLTTDFRKKAGHYGASNPYTNVLGVARSILAISTLVTLVFNNWDMLFPEHYAQSIIVANWIDRYNIFHLAGYENLHTALWFCIAVLILVISGYLPQITCLLHFWVTFSFFRYCPIIEGGDQLASILCLLFIPFLVFDNRINHWHSKKECNRPYINIWANGMLLFVQVQVSVVYFHAFAGKLAVEEWVNGTATYYWFTHNVFGFPSWLSTLGSAMMKNGFIVTAFTWGSILLEIFLFAALFMTKKRRLYLLFFGIAFHLGIVIVHGLLSFFFSMAAALTIYLVPAYEEINMVKDKALNFLARQVASAKSFFFRWKE